MVSLAVKIAQKSYQIPPSKGARHRRHRRRFVLYFANAASSNVNVKDYSIWGFSTGGKPVSEISLNGPSACGAPGVPKPCTAAFIYAGQPRFSQNDPAVFTALGEDDWIINAKNVESAVKESREAGADIKFYLYRDTNHGFGLRTDTNAEGWLDNVVRHWEEHMRP